MSSRAGLAGRLCLGVSMLGRRSVRELAWRGWRVWDTPPGLFRLGGGILRRCIVGRSCETVSRIAAAFFDALESRELGLCFAYSFV